MVLIGIPLMTTNAEYLFMSLHIICIILWQSAVKSVARFFCFCRFIF